MSEHVKQIGEIVVNLQSLEFLLRRFLFGVRHEKTDCRYEDLAMGDIVDENSITNYHTLGELIDEYNMYVTRSTPSLSILKNNLVKLRDALAHGRIYSIAPNDDCVLLKFSKPIDGKTKVTYCEKMDAIWYQSNGLLTFQALISVLNAGKFLNVAGFGVASITP